MVREQDPVRPMPRDEADEVLAPPPFTDVPLIVQNPPEQRAYLRAYEDVGRPRILVAVNRDVAPASSAARTGADEGRAVRTIDHEAVEVILTDWLAADGQVDILSPQAAANPLSDQQKQELRSGDTDDVARDTGADVVVSVRSRMTEQAGEHLMLRMVAEAVNARDGRSIGRAVVDVPPPLDKPQINKYTRFLARKLMDGMILSWQRMEEDDAVDARSAPPEPGDAGDDDVDTAPPAAPRSPAPGPGVDLPERQ